MIEDPLDLSRLQAKRVTADAQRTLLQHIATSAVAGLSRPAKEGDVEVRLTLREDIPAVSADPARLGLVLANIIGNAIKFTAPGGLVEVTAHTSGAFVKVQVSDSGVGISPSALPHIFDRFFQAHPNEFGDSGGFGLGLAISREIVELHGGSIWAESAPGRGSSFFFTVPVFTETP